MKGILKQRMYGLVMYQFGNSIHAGIQYGHAKDEFILKHWRTKELQQWIKKDKVYVILNGGTTNSELGSLQSHIKELKRLVIKHTTFREEDMDNITTAVAFLIDERVFDRKKYPSLEDLKAPDNQKFGDAKDYYFLEQQAKKLEKIGIFEKRNWLFGFQLSR